MATTVALASTSAIGMGSVSDLTVKTKAAQDADAETPLVPIGDAENQLTNLVVPAKSYVLLVHDEGSEGLPILPSKAKTVQWAGMPNLETLLFSGGSITLTRAAEPKLDHDGDDANDDGKKDTDTAADASAKRDAGARDLVITEVMWARNTAEVGKVGETAHQWIEIYNPLPVDVGGVTVTTKAGRPELPAPSGMVLLDRLSNVKGAGWALTGLGQDGYDDGNANTASTEFISMYRKRDKDGDNKVHWVESTEVYLAIHKGTPGAEERAGTKVLETTTIPRSPVIFNEIANRGAGNTAYEWIELRNVSDANENLKNWQISIVTTNTSDKEFFNFYDKDINIPAGGVLLLVTSDPSGNDAHPLAGGFNIEKGAGDQENGVNADSPRYLIMAKSANDNNDTRGLKSTYADGEGLPNNGEFVLILRKGLDQEGKAGKVIDIAGYDTDLSVNSGTTFTGLWPLVNYPKPDVPLNKLEADKVHRRQKADIDGTRTSDKKDNADHGAFRDVGWTSVGYKRNTSPSAVHGGTPGYSNDALQSEGDTIESAVVISEIMFDHSRNNSQWIELYNTSKMHGADLTNWSIFIVNHDAASADGGTYKGNLTERIDLDGKIPPGQTYLIVSRRTANNVNLPAARITSPNKKRTETMLNPYGFQITLKAKTNEGDANKHKTVDTVGNLGAAPEGNRRADAQSFEKLAWDLPAGTDDNGSRVSIARVRNKNDADMKKGMHHKGTSETSWVRFDMSGKVSRGTYYGQRSDIGSPGHTTGGVLPVSLSKFRPERLKDTGEIVISWITESELNNAGFNILRSETRDGEFSKINTSLIAGQGTTSERTTYTWKDKSAKPNVVYYYQIQDVSLDGQVTTLRQSRLKGNVTAAGKATTTWGELKALQ